MHKFFVCLTIGMLATVNGCGQSESAPAQQANSPSKNASSSTNSNVQPTDPIAKVAYEFFEAVLASNKDAARAKLTSLAVQRMNEVGMDFLLPVSESSKFSVNGVELIEEDMAAVDTVLTEVDTKGQTVKEEITVVLRLENGKWGVMGVVTFLGPNQQVVDGFNFEKPDQPFNPATFADSSTAESSKPSKTVPQQATRPAAQDPFRQ